MSETRSVALLVPALAEGGGVPAVATFLYQVLSRSGRYRPEIISLATSLRDQSSVRLLAPSSWTRGVRCSAGIWQGIPYSHIGAFLSEFEFQRYRPRQLLTSRLRQFDLIQVVAGTPGWALVAQQAERPVCIFAATMARPERGSKMARTLGWKGLWLRAMTSVITRFERRALAQADCVFAESEYTWLLLSAYTAPHKLVIGIPGIATDAFRPGDYDADGPILAVGRWADPRKNVRLLFQAYCSLRQAVPCAPRLILAGATRPTASDWSYAVSLGIAPWIDIRENVSRAELIALYQSASFFVLPSNEEGLGVVILEAMASGLPVISTRCGGPETAVSHGETGYLTPVGDAAALASHMAELVQTPAVRYRMGRKGRQIAEARFSLEATGRVYLDKYDELLNTTPREIRAV